VRITPEIRPARKGLMLKPGEVVFSVSCLFSLISFSTVSCRLRFCSVRVSFSREAVWSRVSYSFLVSSRVLLLREITSLAMGGLPVCGFTGADVS